MDFAHADIDWLCHIPTPRWSGVGLFELVNHDFYAYTHEWKYNVCRYCAFRVPTPPGKSRKVLDFFL